MDTPTEKAWYLAWDEFTGEHDLESSEWLDKDASELFSAGYEAALATESKSTTDGYIHIDVFRDICRDFSSRIGSIYIGDVESTLSALVQQSVGVGIQVCKIGNYGKAYDLPQNTRAFTYSAQPDNFGASRLGRALVAANKAAYGDSIDQGLNLLKALSDVGFGVFEVSK